MGDCMDELLYKCFLVYANVLNKIETASESDELSFSLEERNAYKKVHEAAQNDEKIGELLRKIKESNNEDRLKIIEEFFKKKKEPKNEEEEIAKVYGVDPRNIQSKTLASGKEILCFYDYKLARLVVLEKNKDGKTLTEYLEDIQKESGKYQSDNDLSNASSIMDDQRKETSMELCMISINEIGDHRAEIENLSSEELKKLNYLLTNIDQLGVKSINISNMFYIDKDNKIRELVLDKDNNVRVAEPDGKEFDHESRETSGPIVSNATANVVDFEPKADSDDLNSMFEAPKINSQVGSKGKSDAKRPKVLSMFGTPSNSVGNESFDKAGFVNNIIFVLLMASVFVALIIEIIYFM